MEVKRILTSDGSHTLVSNAFGVPYHSVHGAVQESGHVFIDAGLKEAAICTSGQQLSVLETGFGTGLNAFMTLIESELLGLSILYTALETAPVDLVTVEALNYPEQLNVRDRSGQFVGMHSAPWGTPTLFTKDFTLEKLRADIAEWACPPRYHLIYFDAFAPNAQPHLWQQSVLERYFECLLPGGILVTYCAKGEFKRNLKSAGFLIEPLPGPPGKREMTRARKPSE